VAHLFVNDFLITLHMSLVDVHDTNVRAQKDDAVDLEIWVQSPSADRYSCECVCDHFFSNVNRET